MITQTGSTQTESTKTTSLKISALSSFSHLGTRPIQEDYALASEEKKIFIVADGFGGPKAGIDAAKLACESVQKFLFKEAGDLDATLPFVLRSYYSLAGNVLFNALIYANRQVKLSNKNRNIHEKGGASVVAGFLDGDLLAIANVGVCTAWLFRDGEALELIIPRSLGRLVDPFHPEQEGELAVPLMALGVSEDLEPEIVEYRIKPGDWLAFGSDGILTAQFYSIASIQQKKDKLDQSIHEVKARLSESRYSDNASISLVFFD